MTTPFQCNTPCATCPYRKDVKLGLWHIEHFMDLLNWDRHIIGKVYKCHKNNGSICVGFLMNQVDRDYPSNALRIEMIKFEPTIEYLKSLKCEVERYESIEEMAAANFPELEGF